MLDTNVSLRSLGLYPITLTFWGLANGAR